MDTYAQVLTSGFQDIFMEKENKEINKLLMDVINFHAYAMTIRAVMPEDTMPRLDKLKADAGYLLRARDDRDPLTEDLF